MNIKTLFLRYWGFWSNSLIVPIVIDDNAKVITIQQKLQEKGYLVGAIRQPTVKKALLRVIIKLDISKEDIQKLLNILNQSI